MTRLFLKTAVVLLLASLFACNDNIDVQPVIPETTGTSDDYEGNEILIQLCNSTDSINANYNNFTLYIQTPDDKIITRECTFSRNNPHSDLHLSKGLKAGKYRLLYLEYKTESRNGDIHNAQYGLGCKIKLGSGLTGILDNYNSDLELYGNGTDENPYIITSYTHLMTLAAKVNSKETNRLITSSTWFKQYIPLDLSYASFKCDNNYGWMPIGNSTEPFRGKFIGNEISGLWIKRPNSFGLGLFGCIDEAFIQNVRIIDAEIEGNFAVGAVAGAIITRGEERDCSSISDCKISRCVIKGSAGSLNIGGIAGAVDMLARANFYNCQTESGSISASYNAGGIVGGCGMFSNVCISNSKNNMPVTSEYAGAGGIIATGDTLAVTGCTNSGIITGATKYNDGDTQNSGRGTGGIIGGCGMATIVSCVNTETGDVTGKEGVGGILGSTRIAGGDETANIYNSVILRYCGNDAEIKGSRSVGGICGEAQFGGYSLYNRGTVTGTDYVAGITGCTSSSMLVNTVNNGTISGNNYVSGITGKTNMGNYAICQNYGGISGKERVAGVLGLGSNNTMIHYCGNYGSVTGTSPVGGIVAEIGDEREWSGMDIAECIVGALDIVLGIASPTFTILTEGTEALHGIHMALELVEVCTIDVDWALFGIGVHELHAEHEVHEMESAIEATASVINSDITTTIKGIRADATPTVNDDFTNEAMKNNYLNNITEQDNFYAASDENANLFNDNMNHLRHERSEAIEEKMEQKELVHTIVAGIAVAASTIGAIGSIVLSGGAAAPFFIAAGSLGAIVGGMNAVIKSSTHYSENSVIIWQCANSGNIAGTVSEKTGGIAGIVHDMSIVRDCINTANGSCGGAIVGTLKNDATAYCNLSISDKNSWDNMFVSTTTAGDLNNNYQYSSSGSNGTKYTGLTASEIANTGSFSNWDFSTKWTIPAGYSNSYPIPYNSDMRLSN